MKKINMFKFLKALIAVTAINFLSFTATAMEQTNQKQQDKKIVEEKLDKGKKKEKQPNDEVKGTKEEKNTEKEQKLEKKEDKKKEKEKQLGEKNKEAKDKEEAEKLKEKEKQKIEKNVKDHEQAEEEQIKINERKYKDFNPKDYEVAGYELIVHKKAGVPLLEYVHKNTGAYVVFIPVDKKDFKDQNLIDNIFYKAFCHDDSGLHHFAEHIFTKCLHKYWKQYHDEYLINAYTSGCGVSVVCSSKLPERELLFKEFFEQMTNKKFLEDKELFEVERKRIIDEIEQKKSKFNGFLGLQDSRFFNHIGEIDGVKNVSINDVKRFYEKYIHPSNMCITKYVVLDKEKIVDFLTLLEKSYLNKYDGVNKVSSVMKYKNQDKFREFSIPANSEMLGKPFTNKHNGYFKYRAQVFYDLDKLKVNLNQKEGLTLNYFDEKLIKDLGKFVKKLGYKIFVYCDDPETESIIGRSIIFLELKADDEKLFEEKVLKDNVNKILEFMKKQIKNLNPNELQYLKNGVYPQRNPIEDTKKEKLAVRFSKPYMHNGEYDMHRSINVSFAKYNEPFSKKVFYIGKDNEIIDSKENIVEKIKDNLDSLDILIKNEPIGVDICKGEKTSEDVKEKTQKKESDYKYYLLPIKIKDFKNSRMIYSIANLAICNELDDLLNVKKGFSYSGVKMNSFSVGDYVGAMRLNDKNQKAVFKYLKDEFGNYIKNLKFKRSDFNKLIKKLKEKFSGEEFENLMKNEKKSLKHIKKMMKAIDDFCETGKTDKKLFTKDSLVGEVFNMAFIIKLEEGLESWFNFRNREEADRVLFDNISKLGRVLLTSIRHKKDKIDKKFLRDYKEYILSYALELSQHRIRCLEEINKLLKTVKYEDVLHAIKSAYFCEDKEYAELIEKYKKREKIYKKLSREILGLK